MITYFEKRIFDLQKVYILIELNDILEYTFKIVQIKLKEHFNNLNYKGMIILENHNIHLKVYE